MSAARVTPKTAAVVFMGAPLLEQELDDTVCATINEDGKRPMQQSLLVDSHLLLDPHLMIGSVNEN